MTNASRSSNLQNAAVCAWRGAVLHASTTTPAVFQPTRLLRTYLRSVSETTHRRIDPPKIFSSHQEKSACRTVVFDSTRGANLALKLPGAVRPCRCLPVQRFAKQSGRRPCRMLIGTRRRVHQKRACFTRRAAAVRVSRFATAPDDDDRRWNRSKGKAGSGTPCPGGSGSPHRQATD